MPQTPKMGFPYPTFQQKPFWDTWEAFMAALDASVWASIENASLLLEGGGTISLNPITHELTWTDTFHLLDLTTGGMIAIDPGTLSGVTDGKIVYVQVSRPILGTQLLTLSIADTLGNDVNKVFIGIRRGSDFVLRPQTGLELPAAPVGEAVFSDIKGPLVDGGSIGIGVAMWFPRPLQVSEENPLSDLVELMSWEIIGLSDSGGFGPYIITVAGDQTAHFPANHLLDVSGSTDNDNKGYIEHYQIVSAVLNAGNTDITVLLPGGLSFNPATPDGSVYTGRIQFKVSGKFKISGHCSQPASNGMAVRVANVSGNTYTGAGEVLVQAGFASRCSAQTWMLGMGDFLMVLPLEVVVSVSAGDIFEVQQYFEGTPATLQHSLGQSKGLAGNDEVYAVIMVKRSE